MERKQCYWLQPKRRFIDWLIDTDHRNGVGNLRYRVSTIIVKENHNKETLLHYIWSVHATLLPTCYIATIALQQLLRYLSIRWVSYILYSSNLNKKTRQDKTRPVDTLYYITSHCPTKDTLIKVINVLHCVFQSFLLQRMCHIHRHFHSVDC